MASSRVRQPSARAREAAAVAAATLSSTSAAASTSASSSSVNATTTTARTTTKPPASRAKTTRTRTRRTSKGKGKGKAATTAGEEEPVVEEGEGDDDEEVEQEGTNDHPPPVPLPPPHETEPLDDNPRDEDGDDGMSVDDNEHDDASEDDDDVDDVVSVMSPDKEPDLTLYCICLGFAGDQPMIQCEHCSNWFHFSCVGIDDDIATLIEAYCCDICRDMGIGVTRYRDIADTQLAGTHSDDDGGSEEENDDVFRTDAPGAELDLPSPEPQDDEEYTEEVGNKRSKTKDAPSLRDKKKAKVEPTTEREPAKKRVPRRRTEHDADFIVGDDVDAEVVHASKPAPVRVASTNKPKAMNTNTKEQASATPVDATTVPDAPPTDRVRAHVAQQLRTIFLSIFSASDELPPEFHSNEDRVTSYATDVEADMFNNYAEVDLKANVRGPRAKYSSKFRSLHYNLRTNANFRERIASNELTAAQIVGMTNEDLLRPELKAMAETLRAASLKHSVKEVIGVPTAKRTHKGEEEISADARKRLVEEEDKALTEHERRAERDRSESISESAQNHMSPRAMSPMGGMSPPRGMSPTISMSPRFGSGSPPPQPWTAGARETSPIVAMSPPLSSTRKHRESLTSLKGVDTKSLSFNLDEEKKSLPHVVARRDSSTAASPPPASASAQGRTSASPVVDNSPFPAAPAPKPRQRSSFDMASIWSKVKATHNVDSGEKEVKAKTTPEVKDEPQRAEPAIADEKGAVAESTDIKEDPKEGDEEDDDEFEAELFGTAVKGKARKASLPKTIAELAESFTSVWNGDMLVPDEGGFPAFAVQAGGRPLGVDRQTWAKILPPRTMTTAGRLSTEHAAKYLLECWGAPARELVVLAIMPDLRGPTADAPHRPIKEKCIAKHRHVVDYYVKKDRVGVMPPPKHLKALLRDLYIVPLKKGAPMPEYLQVLDDCSVPIKRESDLLLAVLVVQKNALPTVEPPPPSVKKTSAPAIMVSTATPMKTSLAAASLAAPARSPLPPSSASSVPGLAPPPVPILAASPSPTIDAAQLATLSSLLSNPTLIQSALASVSTPPIVPAPPAGFSPPPGFTPPPGGSWGPSPTSAPPPWPSARGGPPPPPGSSWGSGSMTPQWNRGNDGGYSPVPQNRPGGMSPPQSASAPPPGIHPSRLALLEADAQRGGDRHDLKPNRREERAYEPVLQSRSFGGMPAGQGWAGRGRGRGGR